MAAKVMEVLNVDVSEIKDIIEMVATLQEQDNESLNLCFHGSPGIGKTQGIMTALQQLGYIAREMKAPQMDPVDIGGFPMIKDDLTTWATPDFLITPPGEKLAIFADELNRAAGMTQNSLLSLFQERRVRNFHLDPKTILIAACNREGDDIGIQAMSRALCNRFVHVYVQTSLQGFLEHAIPNNFNPIVIGTLKFRPNLLNPAYDEAIPVKEREVWKHEKAYPTPRSWETVSKILNRGHRNRNMIHSLIAGAIGYGPAIEVMAMWEAINQLPSIDAIFLNPDTAKLPKEPSQCYAVALAIARRIDEENIDRAIIYLNRLDLEYNVLAIKEVLRRDQALAATKGFAGWAIKYDGRF